MVYWCCQPKKCILMVLDVLQMCATDTGLVNVNYGKRFQGKSEPTVDSGPKIVVHGPVSFQGVLVNVARKTKGKNQRNGTSAGKSC